MTMMRQVLRSAVALGSPDSIRQAQRHFELAAHQANDAVELAGRDRPPLQQRRARAPLQYLHRALDPARRGGAMHAIERADLVDAELVDEAMAQQHALARRQLPQPVTNRLLEGVA